MEFGHKENETEFEVSNKTAHLSSPVQLSGVMPHLRRIAAESSFSVQVKIPVDESVESGSTSVAVDVTSYLHSKPWGFVRGRFFWIGKLL